MNIEIDNITASTFIMSISIVTDHHLKVIYTEQ